MEEVARIQASWREMGITDEEAMRRTVEEELLPVINKKQKALEKILEKMDKNFEEYANTQVWTMHCGLKRTRIEM